MVSWYEVERGMTNESYIEKLEDHTYFLSKLLLLLCCLKTNQPLQADGEGQCSEIDLGRPSIMEYYQHPEGKPRRP